jgi:hypothetical protein
VPSYLLVPYRWQAMRRSRSALGALIMDVRKTCFKEANEADVSAVYVGQRPMMATQRVAQAAYRRMPCKYSLLLVHDLRYEGG